MVDKFKIKFLLILFFTLVCADQSYSNQAGDAYPSIYLEADNLIYSENNSDISAIGNAKLFYKNYIVEADKIIYKQDIDQVLADGNVVMSEKNNVRLEANKITLSNDLKEGFIEGANMILQDGSKISSEKAELHSDENIFMNARYTFCEECIEDNNCPYTWEFMADEVLHDVNNKKLVFKNIKFKLFDKKIFGIPSFSYPDFTVKRQSGFLLPSYSYSNFYGHGIKTPYLRVIDQTSDVTITPFTTTRQGPLFDIEYRKKIDSLSEFSINPTFIHQANPSTVSPGNERLRASLKTNGSMVINDKFNWGWNATFASDETYMRRYGLDNRTKYNSNIYMEGLNNKNYLSLAAVNYKNLLNEDELAQVTLLPRFDHTYFFNLPYLSNLSFNTNLVNTKRITGDEQRRISSELEWFDKYITKQGLLLSPSLSLRSDFINSFDESSDEHTTLNRVSTDASIKVSWPFFNKSSYGKQIIEPQISFGYINDEKISDDLLNEDANTFNFNTINLFENNRSLGFDKIDSGSKFTLGLDYFLEDEFGGNWEFNIGKSFHVNGLNTFATSKWSGTNNYHSNIVGSMSYNLNETIFLDYKTRYDEQKNEFMLNEFNFEITQPKNYNIGLNYTKIKPDANWLNASINDPANHVGLSEFSGYSAFNISDDWSIISSGTYNLETEKLLNSKIGLRYDDECLAFDIAYRENLFTDRDIKKDKAFLFNFELKTAKSTK